MRTERKPFQTRRVVVLLMALAVLVPSLYGFGTKFLEFVALYRGDVEGVFAISPILNYLLASCGFLLLFGWAVLGGMFRDIEQPKYAMLENEARLDREENDRAQYPLMDSLTTPGRQVPGLAAPRPTRFGDYYEHD
jgi:hypothetical protein